MIGWLRATFLRVQKLLALSFLAGVFLFQPRPAPAYFPIKTPIGASARWDAGSPPGAWNNATQTLTWSFYGGGFPQLTWPSVEQAGAAVQNAFQTHSDVLGKTIQFVRASDSLSPPALLDGRLTVGLVLDQTSDFYGMDISGALAVTYVQYFNTGSMQDADIFINGDPTSQSWSVDGSSGTYDVQQTATHESMHMSGAQHSPYQASKVYPTTLVPRSLLQDRCSTPDDRGYFRVIYPAGSGSGGFLNGNVSLSGGGSADRAVVVATDSVGIPQGIAATAANGQYQINVPAGANYSLTVFSGINSRYFPTGPTDLDFLNPTPASDFTSATTVTGQTVTDGNATAVPGIVANNPGGLAPTMTLIGQCISPAPFGFQVLFLVPGSSGTIRLLIDNRPNPLITTAQITSVTLGSGQAGDIVVTGAPVASTPNGITSIIDVPYSVPGNAIPGFRNLSVTLNVNGNERLTLPSILKVLGTGGLALSAAAGNPPSGSLVYGAVDVPLLRVHLQASAATSSNNEDVRLRPLVFPLAGTGPTLPAVRLWVDRGTPGVVDGADTRVFSGAAYQNSPISETLPATPGGIIVFDNLALSVPAGQGIDLLLTADIPASGDGDYIASLDTASLTAHGMWWGDVINPTGGPVTGGTHSLGTLAMGGLQQNRTTAGTVIPVGGTTTETQVTLTGTPICSTSTCGMEVEVKPVGTPFNGTGTVPSANTFASGATVSVLVSGLTDLTGYHWRARAISPILTPSAWVSFGSNTESAIDFGCDSSTTGLPSGLVQLEANGTTPVPLGGLTHGSLLLGGAAGTNSGGLPVRVEMEVVPATAAFTNTPTIVSGFGASGSVLLAVFQAPTDDYHWQARTANSVGGTSGWVSFDPAPIHFHLEAILVVSAKGGCSAVIGGDGPDWRTLLAAAGALFVLVAIPRRGLRKTGCGLFLLLAISAPVLANQDPPLPRYLYEMAPGEATLPALGLEDRSLEPAAEPRYPLRSAFSVDAYAGILLMDTKFSALGTDFVQLKMAGTGTFMIGAEGLYAITPDWRVGLQLEADLWSSLRIIAVGAEGSWRFASSHSISNVSLPEMEHFVKLSLLYEDLAITKSGFGSFQGTLGIRGSYEFRYAFADRWTLTLGVGLQYAQWSYIPSVLSGDDQIGGIGGILTAGVGLQF